MLTANEKRMCPGAPKPVPGTPATPALSTWRVLSVIVENGSEAAEIMTSDPQVDMVSFTGSTAVGRMIAAQAAPTLKRVTLELGGKSAQIYLEDALHRVGMGAASPGPAVPVPVEEEIDARHATVDLGNPHLVIESSDPTAVDLATRGAWLEQQFDGGVNVEFVAKDGGRPDTIVMRVWERGAGITQACGTGACAAAHAAHTWGLVGERVTVEMPGGAAEVQLGPDIVLTGPAELVAHVEVPDG